MDMSVRAKRIAIISKRETISHFFELEARRFGFEVALQEKATSDLSAFDMCIIDLEGLRRMPSLLPKKVLLVSDGGEMGAELGSGVMRIGYPVPLEELDAIYAELAFGAERADAHSEQIEDKDCIFFYRELENTVRYRERNILLSDYEQRLLERLCRSVGEPVNREELNRLLGAEKGNISDVYICRLRRKLEAGGGKRIIFTVRNSGYKIISEMKWE